MSDEKLEAYIKTIEPNFNSHLEKGTIEMSNEYFNLLEERMARLINKNQSLKKQIEETNGMIEKCGFVNIEQVMLSYCGLIAQQKEFIKWLEDYLNLFDYRNIDEQAGYDMLEEILQKYKEIIGGKDER